MAFASDLKEAADDLFDLAGEAVSYAASGSASYPVSAIFRGLTPDDLVSEHVMADAVICKIRESDLSAAPARGNIITRPLAIGEQTLEVVDRKRDESGIWTLTCQQNIRVVP